MSSGPGILQRRILDTLRKYDSFVAQRKILSEIAEDTNKIEVTGELCPGIPTGLIGKSFEENFRRAVNSLGEEGSIEIKKAKYTNLHTALDHFSYDTSELEVFRLRQKFLPTITEYVKKERPRRFGSSKIEERQIGNIRKTEKYKKAVKKWYRIQKRIISILESSETEMFDQWIECLVRGRHLFLGKKIAYSKSFVLICNTLKKQESMTTSESNALHSLNKLILFTFNKTDWEMGQLKSVLYGMVQFQRQDTLNEEVKDHLKKMHEVLVTALPGHEEPKKRTTIGAISWNHVGKKRKYSEYLNKLLTKQILKNHAFIKIPLTPKDS